MSREDSQEGFVPPRLCVTVHQRILGELASLAVQNSKRAHCLTLTKYHWQKDNRENTETRGTCRQASENAAQVESLHYDNSQMLPQCRNSIHLPRKMRPSYHSNVGPKPFRVEGLGDLKAG